MAARLFCRFDYLFVGSVGIPEFNIVFYRIVKQIHVLEHHTELRKQIVVTVLFYIRTAYQNTAAANIPKARHQIAQRRFTGTGRTDNRRGFIFGNYAVKVFKQQRFGRRAARSGVGSVCRSFASGNTGKSTGVVRFLRSAVRKVHIAKFDTRFFNPCFVSFAHNRNGAQFGNRFQIPYGNTLYVLHGTGNFKTAENDKRSNDQHNGFIGADSTVCITQQSKNDNCTSSDFKHRQKNHLHRQHGLFHTQKCFSGIAYRLFYFMQSFF